MSDKTLSPRVAEIRSLLLALIERMSQGEALPPERELSERWSVARMTLRRATDDLVVEGVLARRRGAGTFLSHPRLSRRLAMTSFTEDMIRRGKVPSSRALEFRTRNADRAASQQLRVPIGERIVAFTRLRLADGEPMAIESSMVPAALVPGLVAADLEGSWYELLSDRYDIQIESASFNVDPILPGARQAQWLGVPDSQPCLRVKIVSLDGRGRIIEAGDATYRGDTYSLSAVLSSSSNNNARNTARRPRTA